MPLHDLKDSWSFLPRRAKASEQQRQVMAGLCRDDVEIKRKWSAYKAGGPRDDPLPFNSLPNYMLWKILEDRQKGKDGKGEKEERSLLLMGVCRRIEEQDLSIWYPKFSEEKGRDRDRGQRWPSWWSTNESVSGLQNLLTLDNFEPRIQFQHAYGTCFWNFLSHASDNLTDNTSH